MSTNRKKITIISSYFAPAWSYGGPPKVLFSIAKTLVKKGIKVSVITTDSLGETRSNILTDEISGITVYRLKNLSNTLAFKTNFFYVLPDRSIIKKILQETDRVLFSDIRSAFNFQMLQYVKSAKIPYDIFAFGEIPYTPGIKSVVKWFFDKVWVKEFIKNATYLFAQTEHEKEMYKLYFHASSGKIRLLPLPIENKNKNPDDKKINECRKKWHISEQDKVIIFVGRINYLKGIDILIKSVENLLRSNSRVKLLIVGRDDGYLTELENYISDDIKRKIIFTGPLYGDEVNTAYFLSSCFAITPRFYEETSTAALEAMSFGVPVVVTKEAEIPYLSDYSAGFTVENKLSDISTSICKILFVSDKERKEMGKEAIRCIQEHFLAEKVAKQLLGILKI